MSTVRTEAAADWAASGSAATAPEKPSPPRQVSRGHLALVTPEFVPRPRLDQVRPPKPLHAVPHDDETHNLAGRQSDVAGANFEDLSPATFELGERHVHRPTSAAEALRSLSSPARVRRLVQVVGVALAIVVALVVGSLAGLASQTSATPASGDTEVVVVDAGDSLWNIAAAATATGGDVRETVHEIRDINGMDSSVVNPGQELAVPSR